MLGLAIFTRAQNHIYGFLVYDLKNKWGRVLNNLDAESAEQIYRELYRTLGKAIGFQMARNIVKMGEEGFDKEKPLESIADLNESLVSAFGKATAKIMLATSVRCCFEAEKSALILEELQHSGLLGDGK